MVALRNIFRSGIFEWWTIEGTPPSASRVENGEIVCKGTPNGFLRTKKPYRNYMLRAEFLERSSPDVQEALPVRHQRLAHELLLRRCERSKEMKTKTNLKAGVSLSYGGMVWVYTQQKRDGTT